jgi:hypothetical protein
VTEPPPIVPGEPTPPYGQQVPPPQPAYYQPPPGYVLQPANQPDPNAGVRKAGEIALWIWIIVALIPLAVIGLCVFLCFGGAIVGAVDGQR